LPANFKPGGEPAAQGWGNAEKFCIAVMAAGLLAGCMTANPYTGGSKISNTAKGAALGAGIGALGGLLVGGSHNAPRNVVLIGAGLGALTGGSCRSIYGSTGGGIAGAAARQRCFGYPERRSHYFKYAECYRLQHKSGFYQGAILSPA